MAAASLAALTGTTGARDHKSIAGGDGTLLFTEGGKSGTYRRKEQS
jgi:hypothetical protein